MKDFIARFSYFTNNISTLKETSKDTSKVSLGGIEQYLTDVQTNVINFDAVKTEYTNKLGLSNSCACSVDALIVLDGKLAFIEFKNGKVVSRDLRLKVKDSLLIFCDITGKQLDFTREKVDLYVVYNKSKVMDKLSKDEEEDNQRRCSVQDSESRDRIWGEIAHLSNDEIVRFCLKRFKWLYFHDVHTYTKDDFAKISKGIVSVS